jgi:hypothetical protein
VEILVPDGRLASVHAHPHPEVGGTRERQRPLHVDRAAKRFSRAGEGEQMAVTDRLDQGAAVLGDEVAQQRLVVGERSQPSRLAEALEQGGGAFDVREEHRDGGHGHILTDAVRAR